jgi:hypothetical protein
MGAEDEATDDSEAVDEIEWVDEPDARAAAPAPPVSHKPWPDPGEFAAEEIESERQREQERERQRGRAKDKERESERARAKPEAPPTPRPATARPAREPVRPRRPAPADMTHEVGPLEAEPAEPLAMRLGRLARAYRNPLIFLTVALVVVATVAYSIQKSRLAEMPLIAERGWTEGLPALDEGRLDAARQLLFSARDAVDALGDRSEHASDIRQAAREAAILTQLCPDPLSSLLDQATRSDDKEWATQFDRLYRGRSVVIDAHVKAVRDGESGGRYELDLVVLPQGEGDRPRSMALIDLRGFTLIETIKPRVDDHLLFGARLASFKFDLEREVWLVGLEPDSGVTMVHHKALAALGKSSGDEEEDQP